MTKTGTILSQVLDALKIPYSLVDADESVIAFKPPGTTTVRYVINTIMGVNSESDTRLCSDKAYTYDLIKDVVAMPETRRYLDPDGRYPDYHAFESQAEIIADIRQTFREMPLIIKKNRGSMGNGVYLCQNWEEVTAAVAATFRKDFAGYDYLCIAQTALSIQTEWRVIMYKGKLQFMYEKDIQAAQFTGNLSPLHWENSTAKIETDVALQAEIQAFLDPFFTVWQLPYGGFDVVRDTNGKLWQIEVNSHPAFSIFLRDNDPEPLRQLFRTLVKDM
ncbi:MAG: hypothetical protein GW762_01530 [Candidatus Pacebacteria bacterium]|nr:hypothetical protein [Candidatus Paceibacterota bacterium]PIR63375.1 MAG: hypothetical protein COU64_04850 [Candidatus Pacebacteria bacterium CG10_big_fil_rev_8_21_14_0_10_40_26]PIZ79123.1 MAG: hypothetical protein COY01_01715 [Candidatus Pacebacteria bacterium CG_4_10_14_0_2_um_filter_40_20]PJA69189.1 MAG: hypothetical protein CO156_01120 [Candidatus Pacebacteria bacterium CG_4_9_14_3_um_filter_40_12]PJC42089.1 MAG: hypothetical protein CO041_00425 [Candidatus Pacebacteria bacterium CG_4_9_